MENKEELQIVCPYADTKYLPPLTDDEVNVSDVLKLLWSNRFLILLTTVLVTGIAIVNIVWATKNYETKASIFYPSDFKTEVLLSEINLIVPEVVLKKDHIPYSQFQSFLKNLGDRAVQNQFWAESKIIKRLNNDSKIHPVSMSKTLFMQNLVIETLKGGDQLAAVSLSGREPDVITVVLNDFLSYVNNYTARIVIEELEFKLSKKKSEIEKQIQMLRKNANGYKQQRIANLKEQKAIAERLKIFKIPQNITAEPIYARGVKAIQAEIDILRQRTNNDFMIETYPRLKNQLEALNEIDISNAKLAAVRVDAAVKPEQPKKQRWKFIVGLSLLLGALMGIAIVILMKFITNMRQNEKTL